LFQSIVMFVSEVCSSKCFCLQAKTKVDWDGAVSS